MKLMGHTSVCPDLRNSLRGKRRTSLIKKAPILFIDEGCGAILQELKSPPHALTRVIISVHRSYVAISFINYGQILITYSSHDLQ